ncbi:MAG TPA: hypothetical protein VFQ27_07420 [Xanthobacteraceae bacterium]|nr:hypothetical protein [Xanthobacteraceae bacterium]
MSDSHSQVHCFDIAIPLTEDNMAKKAASKAKTKSAAKKPAAKKTAAKKKPAKKK